MAIHDTVQIDSTAVIGANVSIAPYTVIGANVNIGDNSKIGPHVFIECNTTIGSSSVICKGAAIGVEPQDIKYNNQESYLEIGENATIRENTVIARGSEQKTTIGKNFVLMAHSQVSHDCTIGDNVVLSKSVTLMGNITIGNFVIIASQSFVNRNCRIGELAFIGGGFRVIFDVPPYILAADEPLTISGINSIALQKHEFSEESIENINSAYKLIHSKKSIEDCLAELKDKKHVDIDTIIKFYEDSSIDVIR